MCVCGGGGGGGRGGGRTLYKLMGAGRRTLYKLMGAGTSRWLQLHNYLSVHCKD